MLELLKCVDCWPQAGGHTGIIVSVTKKNLLIIYCMSLSVVLLYVYVLKFCLQLNFGAQLVFKSLNFINIK